MKLYDCFLWLIAIAMLSAVVALFLGYYDIAIGVLVFSIIAYGIF